MVTAALYYFDHSSLMGSTTVLQPEVMHSPTFFSAETVDPELLLELFYRLFRIVKIRTGRQALSEARLSMNYDPIITVDESEVKFETFSNDMTHYSSLILNQSAFENVKEWQTGQTNIDFTPSFIKELRAAGPKVLKSIEVDPHGFSVNLEEETLTEKKVDLPDNWEIALKNIRTYSDPTDVISKLPTPHKFVQETPFGPFIKHFAKLEDGWVPREGWKFARMNLRNNLGSVVLGVTDTITERFDGRQNPHYVAIRDSGTLRSLKSYLLKVKQLHGTVWEVEGGGRVHIVQKKGRQITCDCKDFRYGRTTCKHTRAVFKPKVRVDSIDNDVWRVITRSQEGINKHIVKFQDMKFQCSCPEYKRTNICFHIVEILRSEKDFQFDELIQDLT